MPLHQQPSRAKTESDSRMLSTPAGNAIYFTTELLEKILIQLPNRDLHTIQQVSTRIHAVIARSPMIQRKIFNRLTQNPNSQVWRLEYSEPRLLHHNRTQLQFIQVRATTPVNSRQTRGVAYTREKGYIHTPIQGYFYLRLVKLNPCLTLWPRGNLPAAYHLRTGDAQCIELPAFEPEMPIEAALQNFPEDSRSTAYITDPPCHEASVSLTWTVYSHQPPSRPGRECVWECYVESAGGLRIGDLRHALFRSKGKFRVERSGFAQDCGRKNFVERSWDIRLWEVVKQLRAKGVGEFIGGEGRMRRVRMKVFGVLVPREGEGPVVI